MYTGILHVHASVVLLFVLIYLVKTVLLLFDKDETLAAFVKRTKVLEMVVSTLFLLTGIYLFIYTGNKVPLLYIKIAIVLLVIPLAVVGFKRKNKVLASLAFVMILLIYGSGEMIKRSATKAPLPELAAAQPEAAPSLEAGEALYTTYCTVCHGENGAAGLNGSKNLQLTDLTDEEIANMIKNGKGAMPAYKKLSDNQVASLTQFVRSLKQ
jgi:mono/diheme cytochrome c family protein